MDLPVLVAVRSPGLRKAAEIQMAALLAENSVGVCHRAHVPGRLQRGVSGLGRLQYAVIGDQRLLRGGKRVVFSPGKIDAHRANVGKRHRTDGVDPRIHVRGGRFVESRLRSGQDVIIPDQLLHRFAQGRVGLRSRLELRPEFFGIRELAYGVDQRDHGVRGRLLGRKADVNGKSVRLADRRAPDGYVERKRDVLRQDPLE